jgi:hypothetical protein
LKPWEIWTWQEHPCVIVSNSRRVERKERMVVLKCQSLYAGDPPAHEFESILDETDGLGRRSICTCDLFFTVRKSEISQKRGEVSLNRRQDISRKMIQALAIAGL